MNLIIKFLVVFVISSCSVQGLYNSYNYVYDRFNFESLEITDDIKNLPYASAIIQIDRNDQVFSVLAKHKNAKYTWATSNKVYFETKNGKLLKTVGLENDFNITFIEEYAGLRGKSEGYIKFDNPDSGYLDIFFSYKEIENGFFNMPISNKSLKYILIEETFSVPKIKWHGKNYYWVDKEFNVWLSKQELNPFGSSLKFKLLKKYSG